MKTKEKEIREFHRPVTIKGTVTIPVEVRRLLGVKSRGQVRFRVVGKKRVELLPPAMTLEEAFGSVKPRKGPEDFKELREKARAGRVRKVVSEMKG